VSHWHDAVRKIVYEGGETRKKDVPRLINYMSLYNEGGKGRHNTG